MSYVVNIINPGYQPIGGRVTLRTSQGRPATFRSTEGDYDGTLSINVSGITGYENRFERPADSVFSGTTIIGGSGGSSFDITTAFSGHWVPTTNNSFNVGSPGSIVANEYSNRIFTNGINSSGNITGQTITGNVIAGSQYTGIFRVNSNGIVFVNGYGINGFNAFDPINISCDVNGSSPVVTLGGSSAEGVSVRAASYIAWTNTTNSAFANRDLLLGRFAAGHLLQARTTNAQRSSVANTYTSSTSHELGTVGWASNILQIGTFTGSAGGTNRELALATANTNRWGVTTGGNLYPYINSTYDFGTTGLRPNNIYGSNLNITGTVTSNNPILLSQRWSGGGTFTGVLINVVDSGVPANSMLLDIQKNGVSRLSIPSNDVEYGAAHTVIYLKSSTQGNYIKFIANDRNGTLCNSSYGNGLQVEGACLNVSDDNAKFRLCNGNSTVVYSQILSIGQAHHAMFAESNNPQKLSVANQHQSVGIGEWMGMHWINNTGFVLSTSSGTGISRPLALRAGSGTGTTILSLTTSNRISLSTPPQSAASVASTHKIPIEISGTIYYLLASNV